MAELETKSATEDWIDYVDQVYEEYFPLNKVGMLYAAAIEKASMLYEQRLDNAQAVWVAQRTQEQLGFLSVPKAVFIQTESDKVRDLAYENSLLLM